MPAKTTTNTAAMQRVWQAELKTLGTQRRKILRDLGTERLAAERETRAAEREARLAATRREQAVRRITQAERRCIPAIDAIDRRIGLLEGRLGR